MSGRKYTTISLTELNRLRREANSAVMLRDSLVAQQILNNETMNYLNQQNSRITSLNTTIRSLNTALNNQAAAASEERQRMRDRLTTIVTRTNNALAEMNRRHRDDLTALNNEFHASLAKQRDETVSMIEQSNAHLTNALNTAVSELEEGINTVSARVDQAEAQIQENAAAIGMIINSDAALLDFAREYAETAQITTNDTANNFRTELLLPGRLQSVRDLLVEANREIADCDKTPTNASVARLSARQAFEAALQLRQDMVIAEQEWQDHLYAAQCALAAARAQIEASENVKFPDDEVDVTVDVNTWSNGEITALTTRANDIDAVLQKPDALTKENLNELREAANQVTAEAQRAAEYAVIAFAASQDRADIAQDLYYDLRDVLSLEEETDGYEGQDRRAAYRLHLKNPTSGLELVITQTPQVADDGSVSNLLECDVVNFDNNNMGYDQDIYNALEQVGINSTDPGHAAPEVCTVPGYEDRCSDRSGLTDLQGWVSNPHPSVPCAPAPSFKPLPDAASQPQPTAAPAPANNPGAGNAAVN